MQTTENRSWDACASANPRHCNAGKENRREAMSRSERTLPVVTPPPNPPGGRPRGLGGQLHGAGRAGRALGQGPLEHWLCSGGSAQKHAPLLCLLVPPNPNEPLLSALLPLPLGDPASTPPRWGAPTGHLWLPEAAALSDRITSETCAIPGAAGKEGALLCVPVPGSHAFNNRH